MALPYGDERKKRKRQEEEEEFARASGASQIAQASVSKNDQFKRIMREPMEDPAAEGAKIEHVGLYGAPNIYREAPGGRRGMRGKRRPPE